MSSAFPDSPPAKILRILLAFALAFGMTLHVEYPAYAAGSDATASPGSAEGEEPEITGINIYAGGELVASSSARQQSLPTIGDDASSLQLKVTPTIDGEESKSDDISSSVKWKSGDGLVSVDDKGKVTVNRRENGEATITCVLEKGSTVAGATASTEIKAEFALNVIQVPVYVTSVTILGQDGTTADEITLTQEEARSYQLLASVGVKDETGSLSPTYTLSPGETLSGLTDGKLSLEWTADGAASIGADGLLQANAPGSIQVTCTASVGVPDEGPTRHSITVTVEGDAQEPSSSASESESSSSSESGEGPGSESEAEPGSESSASGDDPEKDTGAPYIERLEIVKEDGSPFGSAKSLELPGAETGEAADKGEPMSYRFGVKATVVDPADGSETVYTQVDGAWQLDSTASGKPDGPSAGTGRPSASSGESEREDDREQGFPFDVTWDVALAVQDGSAATIGTDGLLSITPHATAVVVCSSAAGEDGNPVRDSVSVNPERKEPGLYLSYDPVPEGQTAFVSSYVVGITGITYITHWEENVNGAWIEAEPVIGQGLTGSQNLERPTVDPYIGRQYRAYIEIIGGNVPESTLYSDPVAIEAPKGGLSVHLDVKFVPEGQDAWFTTTVRGIDPAEKVTSYTWYEWDTAGGGPTVIAEGYIPTYSIRTERSKFGYRYRVVIETSEGRKKQSNIQMLAALDSVQDGGDPELAGSSSSSTGADAPGSPDDPDGPDDPSPAESSSSSQSGEPATGTDRGIPGSPSPRSSSAPAEGGAAQPASPASPNTQVGPTEPEHPDSGEPGTTEGAPAGGDSAETLSELVDRTGAASVSFDNGSTATIKPAGLVGMADDGRQPDIAIDPQVSREVDRAREGQREAELASEPGARWNPLRFANRQPEIDEVLEHNAVAPLVPPFVLGLMAAGALEKYLRFRQQKRPSQARF